MSYGRLIRLSGMSLVVGAVVSLVQVLVTSIAYPGQNPVPYANGPWFVPLSVIGLVGTVLLMLGLPGLYARWARGLGLIGLIGLVLIFITGLMFGVFFNLLSALLVPYLATHAPQVFTNSGPSSFLPYIIIATLAELAGSILLAIPFVRGRVPPRWVGYVLIASAVLAVAGFLVSGPNGPSNAAIGLLSNGGPLLLFVALGAIGYQMLPEAEAETDQPLGSTRMAT